MKKLTFFFIALFALCLTQSSIAQSGFGIRGGVVNSDQSIDVANLIDVNPKSKLGLDLAVLYNYEITDAFSVQPEIHYTQMGWKVDAFIFDLRANLDYIRVPVLLKYDVLGQNENISLSPFIGPYIAFLANEDIDFLSLISEDLPLKKTDVGFDFGMMLHLSNGFFVDARYMLGLTNLNDLNTGVNLGEIKNKGLSVGAGFIF